MKHTNEVTFHGNDFRISYNDDSNKVEDFTPYKRPAPKVYNGLIEVYYTPTPSMREKDCKAVFEQSNQELMAYISGIIERHSALYKNFNIERKFHNFECSLVESNIGTYIAQVRREMNITLKQEIAVS